MSETTTVGQSQGQQALERLQAVLQRFAAARKSLRITLHSISGQVGPSGEVAEGSSGRAETRFFPALDEITEQLDREAAAIEAAINDLAKRF